MSRLKRMLKPETVERQELRLGLGREPARRACLAVAAELGWRTRTNGDGDRITISEDFTQLHCGQSPVRLELALRPEEGGGKGTLVETEATVPGVGGVASKHLREVVLVFAVRLGRKASAG